MSGYKRSSSVTLQFLSPLAELEINGPVKYCFKHLFTVPFYVGQPCKRLISHNTENLYRTKGREKSLSASYLHNLTMTLGTFISEWHLRWMFLWIMRHFFHTCCCADLHLQVRHMSWLILFMLPLDVCPQRLPILYTSHLILTLCSCLQNVCYQNTGHQDIPVT
jgi:hypothetical protein